MQVFQITCNLRMKLMPPDQGWSPKEDAHHQLAVYISGGPFLISFIWHGGCWRRRKASIRCKCHSCKCHSPGSKAKTPESLIQLISTSALLLHKVYSHLLDNVSLRVSVPKLWEVQGQAHTVSTTSSWSTTLLLGKTGPQRKLWTSGMASSWAYLLREVYIIFPALYSLTITSAFNC